MVITRLRGGLGNQMFQYAAGLRLATVHRAPLKLDLTPLDDETIYTPRCYELGSLCVAAEIASPSEIEALAAPKRGRFGSWLAPRRQQTAAAAAHERHFHFDPDVLSLDDDVCLDGYWQSERYFADASQLVREEFAFRQPAAGRNAELAREIAGRGAVSLHVRRGDYVANPSALEVHGLCSLDYYQRAVEYVGQRVASPEFWIFSDDPEWVRANLRIDAPFTIVDHNGPEACHEDLRLMSLCAHHIVANSSFSWWGAWLGANPEKIVVAPQRWFADGALDSSDVIPDAWVAL